MVNPFIAENFLIKKVQSQRKKHLRSGGMRLYLMHFVGNLVLLTVAKIIPVITRYGGRLVMGGLTFCEQI